MVWPRNPAMRSGRYSIRRSILGADDLSEWHSELLLAGMQGR